MDYGIYPLTVVADRYQGCYSGGKWTAWNMYSVRIVMSELTIIAESAERAEEIAMEIYEGDARTHLDHSLFVEACEVDDRGPSDEDEETEV